MFTADDTLDGEAQSALNTRIAQDLQTDGTAVFSTTLADMGLDAPVTCLRAAITNHRTTPQDVTLAMDAVATTRG